MTNSVANGLGRVFGHCAIDGFGMANSIQTSVSSVAGQDANAKLATVTRSVKLPQATTGGLPAR